MRFFVARWPSLKEGRAIRKSISHPPATREVTADEDPAATAGIALGTANPTATDGTAPSWNPDCKAPAALVGLTIPAAVHSTPSVSHPEAAHSGSAHLGSHPATVVGATLGAAAVACLKPIISGTVIVAAIATGTAVIAAILAAVVAAASRNVKQP